MPNTAEQWTAERVRALPDDRNRYELVSGQLIVTSTPPGIHQVAVFVLGKLLDQAGSDAGRVLHSPSDISLGEDEILQPDLFVYRTATGRSLQDWSDITDLLLAVEILTPDSARYDKMLKRHRYQRALVPEYWIVDLDSRLIERWRPDDERPEILDARLSWSPGPGGALLEVDLASFFADLWGEP